MLIEKMSPIININPKSPIFYECYPNPKIYIKNVAWKCSKVVIFVRTITKFKLDGYQLIRLRVITRGKEGKEIF